MATKKKTNVPGAILDNRVREQIELEVISSEARLRLTRVLRQSVRTSHGEDSHQIELIRINRIVNLANTALGRPIYTLELGDWDYEPAEYAWHNGELELVMRRPDTAQLVEILVDLADAGCIRVGDVNAILKADSSGIRFSEGDDGTEVELTDVADLPEAPLATGEHANVRKLVERMDRAMQDRDWSLVLHTGASIFETVAKQVVPNPNVQNQSLGSWFSLYRNHSKLATPLLDTIEGIFKRRNIEPLAGHGSASDPSITEEEAVQVRELTIAFVRLERTLATVTATRPATAKKKQGTP
ncbi:hypothetical protein [Bradyrhizobium sp. WD16]|uniref:hypothetical protein n=1 Tax=Bradyrhizobium sp. WD16 TaxID=1521768 RepID=UPI0020A4D1FD|nr:hypothetical protein [Bradyrhizobium sp. WD16]